MKNLARSLALLYAAVVGLAVIWAWYVEVTLFNSEQEHMLPIFALSTVSFPTSFTLGPLYWLLPKLLSFPFAQLTWLTACGVFQAIMLYLFVVRPPKVSRVA